MAEEEKQEPAAPKKEKSGMPVSIIGLVGFVVILIALLVNVFLILGVKSDVTAITQVITSGKLPEAKSGDEKKKPIIEDEDDDDANTVGQYVADKDAQYFETGRITTNPKSSSRFVVLNLGMFFTKNQAGEEEGGEEKKKNEPVSFSPYGLKFDGMVKNIINSQIGSMSLEELQIPRDSLTFLFRKKLKPLFRQQDAQLRKVAVVEYIVQ